MPIGRLLVLIERWSGGRGSNPRRPAWEAGILPLNYPRFLSGANHNINNRLRKISMYGSGRI